MTQDEIVEIAAQTKLGSKAYFGFVIYQASGTKELEAFAKLVAAKEREAIIDLIPGGFSVDPQWLCDAIRARGEQA